MIKIIFLFVIVGIVAVFSVQNAAPVTISFLLWKFEASLAIVIFLSLLSGIIAGAIILSLLKLRRPLKNEQQDSKQKPQL